MLSYITVVVRIALRISGGRGEAASQSFVRNEMKRLRESAIALTLLDSVLTETVTVAEPAGNWESLESESMRSA